MKGLQKLAAYLGFISMSSLALASECPDILQGKQRMLNSTEEIAIFNMNGKLMTNLGQRAMTAAYNPISVSRLGDTLIVGAISTCI